MKDKVARPTEEELSFFSARWGAAGLAAMTSLAKGRFKGGVVTGKLRVNWDWDTANWERETTKLVKRKK